MTLCALREAQPPNNVWMSLYKPHFLGMKHSFHFRSPVSFLVDQLATFFLFPKDSLLHVADMAGAPCFASSLRHHPGTCEVSYGMIGILSCPIRPGNWNGCWNDGLEMWLLAKFTILGIHVKFPSCRLCNVLTLTDNSWKSKSSLLSEHLYLIYISSAAFHWPLFVTGSVDTPGISWSREILNICRFLQIRDPQIHKLRVKFIWGESFQNQRM